MFNNLTKEIIYYSLIPVMVLVLINLILIIINKRDDNSYKFNYLIKINLMIIDGMVLSLLIGYSVWITLRFIRNGTLVSNMLYVLLFVILIVALVILLLFTCNRLYTNLNGEDEYEKET